MDFGIAGVAAITVIAYVVGLIVKATPLNDKWIPIICGVAGGLLGVACLYLQIPDFPATDIINALAVGIVSGLAATGINQISKQLAGGIDYKTGRLNLAAKYEFKTRMRLKNKSANSLSAEGIPMLSKFKDGNEVAEDTPGLLTVGAQYSLLPSLRISAGWHHYFDVDTKQYTKDMLSDTNEYLVGAEYDINKCWQVSAGAQKTQYGFKDAGMNDISFNVNSYSIGFGVGVQVSEKVKINAAYFQTIYSDYDKKETVGQATVTNSFTRTNRVFGLGVDLTL